MSFSVTMPALGESVTEGTVTRWLKRVGDRVEVDEPLLEVSTDKVDTEIPSPAAGVLTRIAVAADETVEVGAELAVIGEAGEVPEAPAAPAPAAEAPAAAATEAPAAPAPAAEVEPTAAAPTGVSATPWPAPQVVGTPAGAPVTSPDSVPAEATPVTMPALGESVTEGTVTRWLKRVGDRVELDEPLLEVSTDKVDTEIPSPAAGVLSQILVEADTTVEVGATLALIGGAVSNQAVTASPSISTAPVVASAPVVPTAPAADSSETREGASYVTPLVRKLAAEHGVDLATITGTGVGGRIRKQDVLAAAEAAKARLVAPASAPAQAAATSTQPTLPVSPLRGTRVKMSRLRRVIAERMVESLQTSAQLTTVVEVDVTKIARLRARAKADFEAREGVKLSFLPFFAKASVEALKAYPVVNASIEGDEIVYHDAEHLGVAVDTERGLLVPVIHDAGDLNLGGLARKVADLAERTRTNRISPDELSGGTFTLTNTGSRGALFDTPIISQPQVAILGTGAVVKRAVVVDDADLGETIAVRSMVYLALSYDHRLVDGADAARFLTAVKSRLEEGQFEADLGL